MEDENLVRQTTKILIVSNMVHRRCTMPLLVSGWIIGCVFEAFVTVYPGHWDTVIPNIIHVQNHIWCPSTLI